MLFILQEDASNFLSPLLRGAQSVADRNLGASQFEKREIGELHSEARKPL
jgi:hypothetical protein